MQLPAKASLLVTPDEMALSQMSLPELEVAAGSCTGCELYGRATQTVFGAGSAAASLMLLGEQPGDRKM